MDKDLKEYIDWAESQGWEVRQSADGYTRFYTPAGAFAAQYPNTPSNPYRRMKDLQVALRRNGLQIPPPSKKEQRALRRQERGDDR
jgi:hypothetical protein